MLNNKRTFPTGKPKVLEKIGINWKRGATELMGFIVVLPFVILATWFLVMVAQLGISRQSLEHATYTAARAAVVQGNMNDAINAAETTADFVFAAGPFGVIDYEIELEISSGRHQAGSDVMIWEKGALLTTVITIEVDTMGPFLPRTMSSDIVMMIERPARDFR